MKTLTIAQTRQRLGHWGKRALRGEDIGFVVDGRVVALPPVEVHSADDALQEYGVTEPQLTRAHRRIRKQLREASRAGKMVPFRGQLPDDSD